LPVEVEYQRRAGRGKQTAQHPGYQADAREAGPRRPRRPRFRLEKQHTGADKDRQPQEQFEDHHHVVAQPAEQQDTAQHARQGSRHDWDHGVAVELRAGRAEQPDRVDQNQNADDVGHVRQGRHLGQPRQPQQYEAKRKARQVLYITGGGHASQVSCMLQQCHG